MGRVTVVGSYIVALVIDTDRIPVAGETLVGRNFHETHGGKGSNMAAAAARLGARTRFVGKIGEDTYGESFLKLLDEEGVGASGVIESQEESTAVGFIVTASDGSNLIVIDPAANGAFSPDDVLKRREEIVWADVTVSPLEIPVETALRAAEMVTDSGGRAVLNPAPAVDLTDIDLTDVFALTPNETEARVCLGMEPEQEASEEELARRLLDLGPEHVILTRGARGVLWAREGRVTEISALSAKVVDTVGAGDAFNAGLSVGLSEGLEVESAIELGVAAGSISTETRETIDSYPDRQTVHRRLDDVPV